MYAEVYFVHNKTHQNVLNAEVKHTQASITNQDF